MQFFFINKNVTCYLPLCNVIFLLMDYECNINIISDIVFTIVYQPTRAVNVLN